MHLSSTFLWFCLFIQGTFGSLVKTKLGVIEGIEERTLSGQEYTAFLGVPYAKPPINELRFKDPIPVDPSKDILETKTVPDYCIQNSVVQKNLGNDPLVGSEDCLYMNIYVPKGRGNLAVMVYLHGGAFYRGGAREYGPKTILDGNVILVIPNYRLGAFGFLSTEDSVIPGNFGLKDQNLALKWIRDNIASFGGDPKKVTLFGQSAGAAAVHYHLLSPASSGLFQRAILQSGSSLCPWAQSTKHREFAKDIGKNFNCKMDTRSEDFLKCLQRVDAKELLKYVSSSVKFYISPNFNTPRVDGDFIPDKPEILIKKGLFHKMNILTGMVTDEGAAALTSFETLKENFNSLKSTSLALQEEENESELADAIYSEYFGEKKIDNQSFKEFVKMITDRYFAVGHLVASRFVTSSRHTKTYLYEYDYKPDASQFDLISDLYKDWIVHGEELGVLFNGYGIFDRHMNSTKDMQMKTMLTRLWTNFAKTGNPTPNKNLGFMWDEMTDKLEYLHITSQPAMKKYHRKKTVDWWTSLPMVQNKILFQEKFGNRDEL